MKPAGVRRYHQSEASSNFRGGKSEFEAARLAPSAAKCRRIPSAVRSCSGITHSREEIQVVKRESTIEESSVR